MIRGGVFAFPRTEEIPANALSGARGDLQGALLALGATARSSGPGGERSEPLEEFLANRAGRLLLDVSFVEPAAGAFAALDRPVYLLGITTDIGIQVYAAIAPRWDGSQPFFAPAAGVTPRRAAYKALMW